jgi:hypothetical protein
VDAKRIASKVQRARPSRELTALLKWLGEGAPEGGHLSVRRPTSLQREDVTKPEVAPAESLSEARLVPERARAPKRRAAPRRRAAAAARGAKAVADSPLYRVLRRGLSHLPLTDRQRERAVEMAEDAFANGNGSGGHAALDDERTVFAIASALAYAMVYVDRVPLTQTEVAACFRVSVSSLRNRFGALRTRLALTPGDVRWRTLERK